MEEDTSSLPRYISGIVVVLTFLPLVLLVARHWSWLLHLAKWMGHLMRQRLQYLRSCCQTVPDPFRQALTDRVSQRRNVIAAGTACIMVVGHTVSLLRFIRREDFQCDSGFAGNPQAERTKHAGVHLLAVWVFAAFLCLPQQLKSSRAWVAMFAFECAVGLLINLLKILTGDFSVPLDGCKMYRELAFRLLLGMSVPLDAGLLGNAIYAAGLIVLHAGRSAIPDDTIYLAVPDPADLSVSYGCPQFIDGNSLLRLIEPIPDTVRELVRDAIMSLALAKTPFATYAALELLNLLSLMVFLIAFNLWMSNDSAKSLKLQGSEEQLSAFSRILDFLCDATVHLSSDFCITKPAPRLDVMLHFAPSATGMKDANFCELIARNEDRQMLEHYLRNGSRDGDKMSDAIFVHLRGGYQMEVRVQLFLSTFKDVAGNLSFLCGINEVGERRDYGSTSDGVVGRACSASNPDTCTAPDTFTAAAPQLDTFTAAAPQLDRSLSTHTERKWNDVSKNNLAVMVNPGTAQIVNITKEFADFFKLTGSIDAMPRLTALLLDPEPFQARLRSCLDGISCGYLHTPYDAEFEFEMAMWPTNRTDAKRYCLQCSAHFPSPAGGDDIIPESYAITLQVLRRSKSHARKSHMGKGTAPQNQPQIFGRSEEPSQDGESDSDSLFSSFCSTTEEVKPAAEMNAGAGSRAQAEGRGEGGRTVHAL